MTARTNKQWVGKTPDSMPPPMVRLRIFERYGGVCQISTSRINVGDSWDLDHRKPIWDGGENCESNLWPVLSIHHQGKTAAEAGQRAEGKRHRAKMAGIKRSVRNPMPGSRASGLKKRLDGTVVKR